MSYTAINNLSIPLWKKILLRTLHTYGAIVMDTANDRYLWGWMMESGNQYTIYSGVSDPWLAFGSARAAESGSDFAPGAACSGGQVRGSTCFPGYTGTFRSDDDSVDWPNTVWANLQVVAECVSTGGCNP
jgi:hypothetical protein